jgi:hypothetical protein
MKLIRDMPPEERKLYLKQRLIHLRDGYKDEIPQRIVHSTDKDNKYKCRSAWWQSIDSRLSLLRRENLLSKDLDIVYDAVYNQHETHLRENGLTRAEDIAAANALITKIIASLD